MSAALHEIYEACRDRERSSDADREDLREMIAGLPDDVRARLGRSLDSSTLLHVQGLLPVPNGRSVTQPGSRPS